MTNITITFNTSPINFIGSMHRWLACVMLLGLSACVQLPEERGPQEPPPPLVYPSPPDEARFIYERTIYGNFDVETALARERSAADWLTGENSSEPNYERLGKPYAVAVHRGRIFISDTAARVVKVFDVPEGRYFRIGQDNPGTLQKPIGIDVDGAGNLYVADATAKVIMVYDRDGKFLRKLASNKIGEPSLFSRLASVTVDKKGEKVYAVDIGGSRSADETHRIRVFNAQTGAHLFDISHRGSAPGELNLPRDIAISKSNELYIVDSGNFRIQIFDIAGKYLRAFGQIGKQFGNFSRPKEIAIDAEDNVYVIDTTFGNFQIFNPKGELLMFIGTPANIDGPAHYRLPSGITIDEDGRIYVVDQLFRKVDIFRPAALSAEEGYLGRKLKPGEKSSGALVDPNIPGTPGGEANPPQNIPSGTPAPAEKPTNTKVPESTKPPVVPEEDEEL
ncbi:MAG: 6-bladed beta-propeller [Gallionellaceae bacterium]|nr:6-bladed beta-propeller [Gallionellaceae bacterium]